MSEYALEVITTEARDPGSRPPILFLHGSYCGAWVWQEHFIPYFAERGYGSTALSFRGHGKSKGARSLHQFGVSDYVADVEAVASKLERPPIVIAHSMGAKVAERFVENHPVAGVILLAPASPFGVLSSTIRVAAAAPVLWWQLAWSQALGAKTVDMALLGRTLFSTDLEEEKRTHYASRFQQESSRVALEMTLRSYWPCNPRAMRSSLVIGGDRDVLIPLQELERTAAVFQSELQVLPGVNHLLMLDTCWKDVADRALAWIDAQESLGRAA
jgi:pimeloyl-ACP methyl ester carboxylesterase